MLINKGFAWSARPSVKSGLHGSLGSGEYNFYLWGFNLIEVKQLKDYILHQIKNNGISNLHFLVISEPKAHGGRTNIAILKNEAINNYSFRIWYPDGLHVQAKRKKADSIQKY